MQQFLIPTINSNNYNLPSLTSTNLNNNINNTMLTPQQI
jgi:hypothetical protein